MVQHTILSKRPKLFRFHEAQHRSNSRDQRKGRWAAYYYSFSLLTLTRSLSRAPDLEPRDQIMQPIVNGNDLLKTPQILRISVLFLAAVAAFYLGKHWSDGSYPQFIFFNSSSNSAASAASSGGTVAISPNADLAFNLSDMIPSSLPPSPPPPPPPPARYGVVDENGTMMTDFDVGEFDPDLEDSGGGGGSNETREEGGGGARVRVRVGKFRVCDEGMREYIPCLDNVEAIRRLRSTERGERFERFCPDKALDCLVPAPKDYKSPIPWPQSRDEVFPLLTLTANFC